METITVAIACLDKKNNPELTLVDVQTTQKDYKLGFHISRAEQLAKDRGYQEPFICFCPEDQEAIHKTSHSLKGIIKLPIKSCH